MDKAAILKLIVEALEAGFDTLHNSSRKTRAAGNDAESKAEGKYDTRSTEDNYLADGLARQAHGTAQARKAYEDFAPRNFSPEMAIDLGALVQLALPDGTHWFFLGPAGGGMEILCERTEVTVLTPDSSAGKATGRNEDGGLDGLAERQGLQRAVGPHRDGLELLIRATRLRCFSGPP